VIDLDDATRAARAARVQTLLQPESEGLYALLDAARDPRVLTLLGDTHLPFRSLYDGAMGEQLGTVAPYLVSLHKGDDFLQLLLDEAWGDSWGVFLRCPSVDLRELRRHLRRFLRVRDESGKTLLFRWYDPRVLRAFLPACTAEEAAQFFGPITAWTMEGWEGESLVRIARDPDGAVRVHTESL